MTQQEIRDALENAGCLEEVQYLVQQQAILSLKTLLPSLSDQIDKLGEAS